MPSRKHLPSQLRKQSIVKAVLNLAAEQNPNSITTAAIASYMGLTQGALFRHFPNKESIWQAVMEWVSNHLLSRLKQSVDKENSPIDALEAIFLAHIDFVSQYPGVPRMLFGELQHPKPTPAKKLACQLIQKYSLLISQLIEQGKSEDQITADIDTVAATTLFIGSIQGLIMQSLLSGEIKLLKNKAPDVFKVYKKCLVR